MGDRNTDLGLGHPARTIEIGFTLKNMDYDLLMDRGQFFLRANVVNAVLQALLSQFAGMIGEEHLSIMLSKGSVVAMVLISTPDGIAPDRLEKQLAHNSQMIKAAVEVVLLKVPFIEKVATG